MLLGYFGVHYGKDLKDLKTDGHQSKKNITIQRNVHNTIVVDAPQGFIKVRLVNAAKPYQIESRVMQAGNPQTINTQKMNATDKYIVGKYEVEILTLPRTYVTIDVNQSSTTNVDVQAPGFLSYKVGNHINGQIFVKKDDGTFEWVCNIDANTLSGTWQLQPGSYRLVYRQKTLRSSTYTIEKDFRINSNKTTLLNL